MSKAMDEIKNELKTLYPDENLTDEELTQMAQNLVEFFEIGVRSLDKKTTSLVWKPQKWKKVKKCQNKRLLFI